MIKYISGPKDRIVKVPNGGVAILDANNKIVAYNKKDSGEKFPKFWDFVRQSA